jgi:hypothetical protein
VSYAVLFVLCARVSFVARQHYFKSTAHLQTLYYLVGQSVSQSVSQPAGQPVSQSVIYDKCLDSTFSSGKMDGATHDMMTKPRCGLKDKRDFDGVYSGVKRFATLGELYMTFLWGSYYLVVYS